MEIRDKRTTVANTYFKDLRCGDVFEDEDGDVCMKVIAYDGTPKEYAVVLEKGQYYAPCPNDVVIPIKNAYITIE